MPSAPEDLVEGVAELGVAIVDEEPERLLVAELHDEVARLLGDPASVRIRAAGDVLDPSRRERDEEEDVDPLQEGGLDREEVAGEHARRLRSQEGSPRRTRSLRRRLETCLEQHLAHGRRRDRDAETLELADDPLVSPVRVLARETKDQLAERTLERRSPRRPVRVRPPAGDQLAVPAKQRLRLEREGCPSRPRTASGSAPPAARDPPASASAASRCRRRIASSWRRTRISNSFERRGRPSSHTSANRFRTTRYTNDQSKQPSLDHGNERRTYRAERPGRAADEFANPTGMPAAVCRDRVRRALRCPKARATGLWMRS